MHTVRKIENKDMFKSSLMIGTALLISLLSTTILSIMFLGILMLLGVDVTSTNELLNNTWSAYFLNTSIAAITFTFPFLIIKCTSKKKVYEIAQFNRPTNKFAPVCIVFVLGLAMIANIFTSIFTAFLDSFLNFKATQPTIGDNTYDSALELVYVIIGCAVLPALTEEFAFRGIILGSLRKFGDIPAILVSAILFGIFHGNFIQIPFALIVGIGFGLITVMTNSIWPAVIAHFLNNAFSVLISALPKELQIYGSLSFYVIIGLGIVAFVLLIKDGAFKNVNDVPSTYSKTARIFKLLFSPTVIVFIIIMFLQAFTYRA